MICRVVGPQELASAALLQIMAVQIVECIKLNKC